MAVETKDVAGIEIDPEIMAMAEKITKPMTIDEEGVLTVTDDVYADTLPKDLTMDTVNRVHEHDSRFASAFLYAAGHKTIDFMKDHREVKRVSGIISTGRNELGFNFSQPTGKRADGTMKDPSVTVVSRRYEHQDHGKIRAHLSERTKSIMD